MRIVLPAVRTPRRQVSWRRSLTFSAIASLAFAGLTVPPGSAAAVPTEPAESRATVAELALGDTILGDIAGSHASSESDPGPNRSGANAGAFGAGRLDLGGALIPLSDFVQFGEAGSLLSESTARSPYDARAISGALGADGAITLDRTDAGAFDTANIDLLSLFKKAGISGVTNLVVDRAELKVAVGGAEVIAHNDGFLDPDGVGGPGRYRVGNVDLLLHSTTLDGAAAMIHDAVGRIDEVVEAELSKYFDTAPIAAALPPGTSLKARVTSDMKEQIFADILAKPITTKNHVLTVDFSTGTATLHLDQLLHGEEVVDGPVLDPETVRPGDPNGLNSQAPNTELIDDELYPMIAETIHDLMNEVSSVAIGAVEGSLDAVTVDFTATTADANATWSASLGNEQLQPVQCTPLTANGTATCQALVNAVNNARPVVDKALVPAREFLVGNAGDQLFRLAVDDLKTGAITIPVRKVLEPVIEVVAKVVSVRLNSQRTKTCQRPDGTNGIKRLAVSAVSVGLLRDLSGGARLDFGTADVRVDSCSPTASASVIESGSGTAPVGDLGYSEASAPGNEGPNRSGVNGSLLGTVGMDIGGVKVPLDDFLEYGQGAGLLSESTARSPYDARAVVGGVGADGAVSFDGVDGSTFDTADIDLLSLFRKAGVSGLSDLLVDDAHLKLGIAGAEVVAEDGVIQDPDGVGGLGRYRVGNVDLLLHSTTLDEAAAMIHDGVGRLDEVVETQVNRLLDLSKLTDALPNGTTLKARITSDMQEKIFADILAKPITTRNHVLTVDFSQGTATLHLDQVLHGEEVVDGPVLDPETVRPGDLTGINAQKPNTELVDDELYPMIAETIHDLMNEVTSIAIGSIEGALSSVTVDLTAVLAPTPDNSATATWSVNLMGKPVSSPTCVGTGLLGGILCTTLRAAITVVAPVVNTLLVPVRDFLVGDAGDQLFRLAVDDLKTGAITIPARKVLDPFIEVFSKVASVQVNRQRTGTCTTPTGTRVASLRLSAVSFALARQYEFGRLDFGNAAVRTPCS